MSSRSRPGRSRAPLVRALFALAIIGVSVFFTVTKPARLGLDLRGGTQIILETRDSPTTKADRDATERALEVLRRRVDALGVSEPTLSRSGDNRIIVELPGVQDPKEAAETIGRTAQLSFHPVLGLATTPAETPSTQDEASPPNADGERTLADESGQQIRIGKAALTGNDVKGAKGAIDPQSGRGWFVSVDFRNGGRTWEKLTADAACANPGDPARRVAIVLDDAVISSPQVDPSVSCGVGITGGSTQITGAFGEREAKDLAALIQAGALPVPVEVVGQSTVGPTLGAAAIDSSARAAVIGVVLTALFIMWMYRLVGVLATVALACYALISYAALVALGATLTLPGLAGFVLAIGMAVDANVLVFERAREEYAGATRKSMRGALVSGFNRAWSAILDSNVTTLLAAGLLFFLATGPVRGFGVTLTIGVLASMVAALVVTRVLAEWAVSRRRVAARPKWTGLGSVGRVRTWLVDRNPDLMRRRPLWLALSAVLLVVSITGIAVRGLNFGVEFTGGRLVEYSTSRTVDVDTARAAVSDAGFPRAVVQTSGQDGISVRTGDLSTEDEGRIRAALAEAGGTVTKERDESIGPSFGAELRRKALIALAVALGAQLLYLAVRFRWTLSLAAVLAMFHDVLVVTGVFAWFGKPVDGVFLAAILTIVGYSVNDSVVVFDRVRELWGANRRTPFAQIANSAVLQTVPRTVNTGMGALFILAALTALGGDSLGDFALALLLGIVVGTLSTVFTATPLAIEFQSRSRSEPPRPRQAGRASPGASTRPTVRRTPSSSRSRRTPGSSGAVV